VNAGALPVIASHAADSPRDILRHMNFFEHLQSELDKLKEAKTLKTERVLESAQDAHVRVDGKDVLMLTSNNYLGFANHPRIREAQKKAIDRWGAGLGSVRFICGTERIHHELEETISEFFQTEATILYMSCWNANEGLFPAVLEEADGLYSDELNHASIIDGVRLCKAKRYKVPHSDYDAYEKMLEEDTTSRYRMMITDGVFSMEGSIVNLPALLAVCRRHGATLWIDDSHATGVLGERGRGTAEHFGLHGQIDIITSTLGKALGGAAGGFLAGSSALCDYVMQRARPQLFTNALPATVAASALAAIEVLEAEPGRVAALRENTAYFRQGLLSLGFRPLPGDTPIVPVILGETAAAIRMSELLLEQGVFVTGFGFPVVPQGQARVRCQISAGHTRADLDQALAAFSRVGRQLALI